MLRLNAAATSLARIVSARRIRRDRPEGHGDFPVGEVLACLEDEVCPAIAQIWHRSSFRNLVLLPHTTLLAGSDSPARKLVESIRKNLLAALVELQIAMEGQGAVLRVGSQTAASANRTWLLADLKLRADELTRLATDEWVFTDNFFRMTRAESKDSHSLPPEGSKRIRRGDGLERNRNEAAPIGNLIVRGMLSQIENIIEAFSELSREFKVEIVRGSLRRNPPWRPFVSDIGPQLDRLRFLTLSSEEGRTSESAMILTQIYADAAPVKPDITWLGLTDAAFSWPASGVLDRIVTHRDYHLIDRMVLALTNIAGFYERRPPHESEIEDAIETGGLVVVEELQQVFWEKRKISADWKRHPKLWKFMLLLAKTRGRGSVGEQHVYGQPVQESTLLNLRRSLGELLPDSLNILIEPARPRSYRVRLASYQFHFFPAPRALQVNLD